MKTTSALLRFYSGTGVDNLERKLSHMLAWNDQQLEDTHDYIQWLFPLKEPSNYNMNAPLLSAADIRAFKADPLLKGRLRMSFERMLRFYGFKAMRDGGLFMVGYGTNFGKASRFWLNEHNRNYLRITRILKSLRLLGLKTEDRAFLEILEDVYRMHPEKIGVVTLRFWRKAVK